MFCLGDIQIFFSEFSEGGREGVFVIFVEYHGRERETRIGTEYRNEIKIDV